MMDKEAYRELAKALSKSNKKALSMTEEEYKKHRNEFIKTHGKPDPKTVKLINRIVKNSLSVPADGSSDNERKDRRKKNRIS